MIRSKQKLVRRVEEEIHRICPAIGLTVLQNDVASHGRSLWFVPVRPSKEPEEMFAYFASLAEVEAAIVEKDDTQILLTPIPAPPVSSRPRIRKIPRAAAIKVQQPKVRP